MTGHRSIASHKLSVSRLLPGSKTLLKPVGEIWAVLTNGKNYLKTCQFDLA